MFENARKTSLALALGLLSLPIAAAQAQTPAQARSPNPGGSAFLAAVRQATAPYRNINVAAQAGWTGRDPFCVTGEDGGAMGVHVINLALLSGNQPQVSQPQILLYEPQADGSMVLVGVEYAVLATVWDTQHPPGPGNPAPTVGGQLMELIPAPNRYGVPAVYTLHVWAWRNNPRGAFSMWNPNVICQKQPLPIGS